MDSGTHPPQLEGSLEMAVLVAILRIIDVTEN